jgi:hypothetical protein
MLPQPNEHPSQKDDAFVFRLEMLKKELDFIDSSIRKIDDIGNSIKNWAILSWTGAIAIILGQPELYGYVVFSAVPPLLFMMLDAHWRKIQRRFIYRQGLISNFLNSPELDEAFQTRKLNFLIFDPLARKYKQPIEFDEYTSIRRILAFPTVSLLYVGLAALSVVITTLLYFAPPKFQSGSLPPHPPPQTAPAAKATNAATIFNDSLSATFSEPDHSISAIAEILVGCVPYDIFQTRH